MQVLIIDVLHGQWKVRAWVIIIQLGKLGKFWGNQEMTSFTPGGSWCDQMKEFFINLIFPLGIDSALQLTQESWSLL